MPRIRYLDTPPASAELVIVGGGVVGAATAFHLSKAGVRPLILEARPALCTLTTPVAAGAYRLQFDDAEELELVRESADLFLHFADATGQLDHDVDVRERGYLWLTTDEAGGARQTELATRMHELGQDDVDIIDGDALRATFDWVGPGVVQGRWRARDGFLDTKALTFGLAAGADAEVALNAAVTGFRMDSDRVTGVETTRGVVACGAVVVCAGPLSGRVAALAGVRLPIVTVPRQKLILPSVPEVPPDGPMVIDEDTGVHWRPALDGAWLLHTDPITEPTEPTMDVPTDHRFAFRLLDPASDVSAARVVPFWSDVWERGDAHWLLQAGQYTVTPDHRPLIGRTDVEGLFVNTGYSGHGIMLGPAGGRICAEAVIGSGASNAFDPRTPRLPRPQPTL